MVIESPFIDLKKIDLLPHPIEKGNVIEFIRNSGTN